LWNVIATVRRILQPFRGFLETAYFYKSARTLFGSADVPRLDRTRIWSRRWQTSFESFPQSVSIPLVIDRNSQRHKKGKVERAALDARRRLVLRHIVSPVNFISETLEWEAGNRFAPLDACSLSADPSSAFSLRA
jgi:hypothetical protein